MLSPRRKRNPFAVIWGVLYPIGIHFGIGQIIVYGGLSLLAVCCGSGRSSYYDQSVLLTGLTGLFSMLPAALFYKRDFVRRREGGLLTPKCVSLKSVYEDVLLLLMGAGLALYANIFVTFLLSGTQEELSYQNSMEQILTGKSLGSVIFWLGIVAPIAEEMIFRWLIYLRLRDRMRAWAAALLSGLLFGLYHGNLMQGIYAAVLGFLFALLLEWSGNLFGSMFLHIGANLWSSLISQLWVRLSDKQAACLLPVMSAALLLLLAVGFHYFGRKYKAAGRHRAI